MSIELTEAQVIQINDRLKLGGDPQLRDAVEALLDIIETSTTPRRGRDEHPIDSSKSNKCVQLLQYRKEDPEDTRRKLELKHLDQVIQAPSPECKPRRPRKTRKSLSLPKREQSIASVPPSPGVQELKQLFDELNSQELLLEDLPKASHKRQRAVSLVPAETVKPWPSRARA